MAEKSTAPLAGKRIVLTRAPEQSGELKRMLGERGAEVLSLPLVCFAPAEKGSALDDQLRLLDTFDAVLFLSANAVRYTFVRCRDLGIELESFNALQLIAAVGPATARAISDAGVRVDRVAHKHTGEALAQELENSLAGRAVLLPRSDVHNDATSFALRQTGSHIREVVAYRTIMPKELDGKLLAQIGRGEVDAVVFGSPSAVRNFVLALGKQKMAGIPPQVKFAAIGPTTRKAMRAAGIRPAIEAEESSAAGLADAIARFYEKQAAHVRGTS